jgi:hypothetical protein
MTEIDTLICGCTPVGRAELVLVSLVKKLLAADLPAAFRFKFLQWLDKRDRQKEELQYLRITPEVITAVEPMSDSAHDELYGEIMKLGKRERINAIGRTDVFLAFVALNPSLLTAIKLARSQERRAEMLPGIRRPVFSSVE